MEIVHQTERITLGRLVVGALENNVYLVTCRSTGAAVLIDAADEAPVIRRSLGDVTPDVILTTHGHADHVGAASTLRDDGLRFALHPDDSFLVDIPIDLPLTSDLHIVGDVPISVLHTPGHTPGSTCFLVDGVLLTGDTLFPGGPGATRFPYSDFDLIIDSITKHLFSLPDHTPFFPGHGADSTVGAERPRLSDWIRRRW